MMQFSSLLFAALFLYVGACGFLYAFQRDLLYFPTKKYEHPYEEILFQNHDASISVVVLNKGKEHGLLYFGGNGEAVIGNAESFASEFPDITIYLFNYRGYGGSSGSASESAIYADATAFYQSIKPNHKDISVAGRSLGSGIATYLAASQPMHKVVLITPYDSILNVAKKRFLFFPVSLLLKDKYESVVRAKSIKSDVLVLAAEHDQVIPAEHTQALANELNNADVEFKVIKNTGHNNISNTPEYYKLIKQFLQGVLLNA